MKKLLAFLFILCAGAPAYGQQVNLYCNTGSGIAPWAPCSSGNPLAVSATITPSGTQAVNVTQVLGAAISATNGVFVLPTTAATWAVTQSTSPWVVSNGGTFAVQATQAGTWTVTGAGGTFPVTQSTSPWVVSNGGTFVVQGTDTVSSATVPVSTMNSATANSGINAAIAGVFDDAAPTAITENSFGFARMSANRNLYGTIRDAAGNERGANVSAANELQVGSSTLALASNQTATQAPVAPATATATKSDLVGCQATTAAVNPTTGQQGACSTDTNNNILVSAGGTPNLATSQVSVTSSDTAVASARALRRAITVTNKTGTAAIECGPVTVTTANGQFIPGVLGASFTWNYSGAIRCISEGATQTVTVSETY